MFWTKHFEISITLQLNMSVMMILEGLEANPKIYIEIILVIKHIYRHYIAKIGNIYRNHKNLCYLSSRKTEYKIQIKDTQNTLYM